MGPAFDVKQGFRGTVLASYPANVSPLASGYLLHPERIEGKAAARASISRTTLVKIEKGEPGVAIGSYAIVLFVMGLTDRLADLADPKNDAIGLQLEEEHLPQRISRPRKK